MAYKQHPYQWATIGKSLDHIENANINDVKAFFNRHYNPSNAIMVVGGDVKLEEVKRLSEKWFGTIPAGKKIPRLLPKEGVQTDERKETVQANVPLNALYKVFHMPARTEQGYYAVDLISDILSRGNSSRLFRNLLKDKKLFSDINAYLTGSLDAGLFVVEGKPLPGVSMDVAEAAIWEELDRISTELVPDAELTKVKNKMESTMVFSEMSLLDKAMNLAYFELLGDANELNLETQKYLDVNSEEIRSQAKQIFRKENSSTLYYLAN
jgi:predicted Zn-dependent peptidase